MKLHAAVCFLAGLPALAFVACGFGTPERGPSQRDSDIKTIAASCWDDRTYEQQIYYSLKYSLNQPAGVLELTLAGPDYQAEAHPCICRYHLDSGVVETRIKADSEEPWNWSLTLPPRYGNRFCLKGDLEGLRLGGNCVALRGREFVSIDVERERPNGVALSADGPVHYTDATIFGPGTRQGAYGQHYLQLLSLQREDAQGRPLRIPVESAFDYPRTVWLDDERLLLSTSSVKWFAVVHVDDFEQEAAP